jgi:hypothetical protein
MFNSIAQNGQFGKWTVEKLMEFKASVTSSIKQRFPGRNSAEILEKSPSSLHSSTPSTGLSEKPEDRTIAIAEGVGSELSVRREKMPPRPTQDEGSHKTMSRVTLRDLQDFGMTTNIIGMSLIDDCCYDTPVSEQVVLLNELAKLLVRWTFYASTNIESVGVSPVKGKESNGSDGSKSMLASVAESYVQKLHMRALLAMCTSLGVTLHDARNKPHLYLRVGGVTLSGMLDIIFCKDGKVLGGGEFKVAFKTKSYLGQICSSTFGLAAGVNQIPNWVLDDLYRKEAIYHPFNILTNGEHTTRYMTTSVKGEMLVDESSTDDSQSLQRTHNILCYAINARSTLSVEGLSLDSGEDGESGGGGDAGEERNYFEGGDDVDSTDDNVGDSNSGEGGASYDKSEGGHEFASLNMLNLIEHNILMDGAAFLRGMRPHFLQ